MKNGLKLNIQRSAVMTVYMICSKYGDVFIANAGSTAAMLLAAV